LIVIPEEALNVILDGRMINGNTILKPFLFVSVVAKNDSV